MTPRTAAQAIAAAAAGLVADGPNDIAGHLAYLLTDLVEVIGGGSVAGLMIRDDGGRLDVLAASSHRAVQLELFQIQNDQGPCIEALTENRAVHAATAEEIRGRWSRVGGQLAESCQSLEAAPLRWRGRPIGTLNVLHPQPYAMGPEQRATVQTFADIATLILVQGSLDHDVDPTHAVRQALRDRAHIERAKGVLAYTRDMDMAQAYDHLLHQARAEHVPLVELAQRVITDAGPGSRPQSQAEGA